jgi:hypothetical protein
MDAKRMTQVFGDGPDTWLSTHKERFRSEQSLRWWLRRNRERLIKAGALVRLRGAWFALEPAFTREMVKIGREEALAAVREAEAA